MSKFYEVTTDDGMGGSKFLGYATGHKEDIAAYFGHKKVRPEYQIHFRELNLVNVTGIMGQQNEKLSREKMELQKRMDEIENILRLN
ncbi:UNVERIFIED_CONTAM: hypothetical protein POZ17_19785 [Ralstonia mannitolilytica]